MPCCAQYGEHVVECGPGPDRYGHFINLGLVVVDLGDLDDEFALGSHYVTARAGPGDDLVIGTSDSMAAPATTCSTAAAATTPSTGRGATTS